MEIALFQKNQVWSTIVLLVVESLTGEKRSDRFILMQELRVHGDDKEMMDAELFVGPSSKFLELIAQTMVSMYPKVVNALGEEALQLFVLDGSGKNHYANCQQACVRLVWSSFAGHGAIVVDERRSQEILDHLLNTLQNSSCKEIKTLKEKAMRLSSKTQAWRHCFKEYKKGDPICMVFNDRVTEPPFVRCEGNAYEPLYIYQLGHGKGKLEVIDMIWPGPHGGLESNEWLKCTSLQPVGHDELTDWTPPPVETSRTGPVRMTRTNHGS